MMRYFQSMFSNMPPVVKNLLIINVMIWLAMALVPAVDRAFTRYLALYYFTSPGFYPSQLFTYMFLHSNFTHLFFNMFALTMFGMTIERAMGSARFLFFYISVGIGAALMQMGVFAIYIHQLEGYFDAETVHEIITGGWDALRTGYNFGNPDMAALNSFVNTPMVGASGAIYGVLLAFGYLFPNVPIYLFFIPIPIKAKWLVIGYFVLELVLGVSHTADSVAHFAHIGGMVFGFLLLLYWKKKGVFNNHWFF